MKIVIYLSPDNSCSWVMFYLKMLGISNEANSAIQINNIMKIKLVGPNLIKIVSKVVTEIKTNLINLYLSYQKIPITFVVIRIFNTSLNKTKEINRQIKKF